MRGEYKNPNYMKEWRENNKDKVAIQQKTYKARHKNKIGLNRNKWYKKNKMSVSEYNKRYGKDHRRNDPDRIKGYRLKSYGIGFDEYSKLLKKQKGLCGICKKPETTLHNKTGRIKALAVDHDHSGGKIRGLLCGRCNMGIGMFKDSKTIVKNAAKYLGRA